MQANDLQHILVVDDQKHVRLLLGKFLSSRYPAANITFYDPIDQGRPTESFDWHEFDLVILDINLGPGQNGLDWLAEARSHGHSPATLVLTGEGDEETAVRAFEVGALGYLSKLRLTKGRLSEAIDKALAKSDNASRRNSTTQIRSSILNKSLFYNRLSRSVEGLPDGQYADGTYGRGGHSRRILGSLGPQGRLTAFDKDPEAARESQSLSDDPRFTFVSGSFVMMDEVIAERQLHGVLLDLGV